LFSLILGGGVHSGGDHQSLKPGFQEFSNRWSPERSRVFDFPVLELNDPQGL
jgi:hypothetical protein